MSPHRPSHRPSPLRRHRPQGLRVWVSLAAQTIRFLPQHQVLPPRVRPPTRVAARVAAQARSPARARVPAQVPQPPGRAQVPAWFPLPGLALTVRPLWRALRQARALPLLTARVLAQTRPRSASFHLPHLRPKRAFLPLRRWVTATQVPASHLPWAQPALLPLAQRLPATGCQSLLPPLPLPVLPALQVRRPEPSRPAPLPRPPEPSRQASSRPQPPHPHPAPQQHRRPLASKTRTRQERR